jgi:hypothetical protein
MRAPLARWKPWTLLPILAIALLACGRDPEPQPAAPAAAIPPGEESVEIVLPDSPPPPALTTGPWERFKPEPAPPPLALFANLVGENGGLKRCDVPPGTIIRGLNDATRPDHRSVAWAREFEVAEQLQKLLDEADAQKDAGQASAALEILEKREKLLRDSAAGLVSNGATVVLLEEGEPFSQVVIPGITGMVWVPTMHLQVLQED